MKKMKSALAMFVLIISLFFAGCGGGDVRVNLDLSGLSSYAVQSEVQKMQKSSTAQQYLGKNIKMRAKHYSSGDYHYIIGPDGDECCNWQIEIRTSDTVSEYPKTGKSIYIVGEYKYYKEGGKTYYYLELLDC